LKGLIARKIEAPTICYSIHEISRLKIILLYSTPETLTLLHSTPVKIAGHKLNIERSTPSLSIKKFKK